MKWKTKKGKNHFGNHFRERQGTKEKKICQSVRSIPKREVVCKQEIINGEYIHFATWLATNVNHIITSNSNRTPPLTHYSIGRLQNERQETKEKKIRQSQCAVPKMEVVCKQEIINGEYIHFATWCATINVYHFQQQSHTTTYRLLNWKIAKCQ